MQDCQTIQYSIFYVYIMCTCGNFNFLTFYKHCSSYSYTFILCSLIPDDGSWPKYVGFL